MYLQQFIYPFTRALVRISHSITLSIKNNNHEGEIWVHNSTNKSFLNICKFWILMTNLMDVIMYVHFNVSEFFLRTYHKCFFPCFLFLFETLLLFQIRKMASLSCLRYAIVIKTDWKYLIGLRNYFISIKLDR